MSRSTWRVARARVAAPLAAILVFSCRGVDASGPVPLDPANAGESGAMDDGATASADAPIDDSTDEAGDEAAAAYIPVATELLDDMIHLAPDGPRTATGGWSTYSDRALQWSEPPIFNMNPGLLVPAEGTPVGPATDGGGPVVGGSPQAYRRVRGGGESVWGAGLALAFAQAAPDGGPVPMNACDAGLVFDVDAAGADSSIPLPFDASGWTGIQFWAKSFIGFGQTVGVMLLDDVSHPFGRPLDAGGCDICATTAHACSDGPRFDVVFTPEWTRVQVPFAAMHPAGWSGASTSGTVHVAALYALDFQLDTRLPTPPFDVGIAYLELYR